MSIGPGITSQIRSLRVALETLKPDDLITVGTIERPRYDPDAAGGPVKTYDTVSWRAGLAIQNLMPQDRPAYLDGYVSEPATELTAEQQAQLEETLASVERFRAEYAPYLEAAKNTPSMNHWPQGLELLDKLSWKMSGNSTLNYSFTEGKAADGRWASEALHENVAHFEADIRAFSSAVHSVASVTGDLFVKKDDGTYSWGVFEVRDRATGELYADRTSDGRYRYYDDGKVFFDMKTLDSGRMTPYQDTP
jgi:hypothetical protein